MSVGITLEQAQAQLAAWLAASLALATSQSYEISTEGSTRKLTRADAEQVRLNVQHWQSEVARLTPAGSGRRHTRYIVPE